MLPQNKAYLEKYRWTVASESTPGGIGFPQEILRIINEEWFPNYTVDLWCGHCVMEMVKLAFRKMDEQQTDRINIKF